MKKKIWTLFLLVLILLYFLLQLRETYANESSDTPLETAILKFPDNSEGNWKEVERYISRIEAIISTIPLDQTASNWSEMIRFQYSQWNRNIPNPLDYLLNRFRMAANIAHFGNEITWNVIEKNKDDVIYEWILKPYKDIPALHEISRAFLTKTGFYRIGFTRRYGQMDPKEREKWIKLLKENSSVIAFEEAANSEGLSLVDKLKDSVILGSNFQNWSMIRTHNTQYGYINITYIPPTQVDSYITECLEVVTMPVTNAIPMDTLFDVEKQQIQKDADENVEFHVLEESPLEIIYTYSHPKDHLQCNALVRGFHTDYGYYSIRYKRGLDRQLKKPEILQWKEKLKSISVKPSLAGSTNVVRESRND